MMEDVLFLGFNMKIFEEIVNKFRNDITSGMTDSEKKAYDIGVSNAFSIAIQYLEDEGNKDCIQFYNKGCTSIEEFTYEEVIEMLKNY